MAYAWIVVVKICLKDGMFLKLSNVNENPLRSPILQVSPQRRVEEEELAVDGVAGDDQRPVEGGRLASSSTNYLKKVTI